MKLHIFLINILLWPFLLNAQNSQTEIPPASLGKKAIAVIGLTNNRIVETQFKGKNTVPDGFVGVELKDYVLKPLDANVLGNDKPEMFTEEEINKLMNNNRIGQQILAYWFQRKEDGTFDLNAIRDRHLLNVEEINSFVQPLEKKVANEDTETQKTVNSTYILLIDFKDVQTMNEYYDKNNTEQDNRILRGYISDFQYYIIKFDFNNSVASYFFKHCWLTEDNGENTAKKLQFAAADFPFILIKPMSDKVAATQHIQQGGQASEMDQETSEKLMEQLVHLAADKAVQYMENEKAFFKNNYIQDTQPITAGLGAKENLRFDRRYFVFMNEIDESGKVGQKKTGVVKSMKVVDNVPGSNKKNDLSEFYQIAGKKITSSGMYLEKKKDLGINLGFDRSVFGPVNSSARIEYYLSKCFDGAIQREKNYKALTSLKIYFEVGYNDGTYKIEDNFRIFKFFRGAIGLSKDFYPVRNLHWSPFVGYGMESAKWNGSDKIISSNYFEGGVRIGVNVVHNVQLIGTLKDNLFINTVLLDGNREVLDENFSYGRSFGNRKGISFGLGFRVML